MLRCHTADPVTQCGGLGRQLSPPPLVWTLETSTVEQISMSSQVATSSSGPHKEPMVSRSMKLGRNLDSWLRVPDRWLSHYSSRTFVAAWVSVTIVLLTLVVPRIDTPNLSMYVVQPLLWVLVFIATVAAIRSDVTVDRPRFDRWLIAISVLIALFQIALTVLAALLSGFGRSPYAHHWLYTPLNIWYLSAQIAGMEFARWYLIKSFGRNHLGRASVIVWMVMLFALTPLTNWLGLASAARPFEFVGRDLMPLGAEGILATYLAVASGPFAAIAYQGSLSLYEWLAPILPSFNWTMAAFFGVVGPMLGLLIARDLFDWRKSELSGVTVKEEESGGSVGIGWVMVAAIVVFLFWFNTGMFGVRPVLTSGVSMQPYLHVGDYVVVKDVTPRDVRVGDVIEFQKDNYRVLHRVIEIKAGPQGTTYITKGDNNNAIDDPVQPSAITGRVFVKIPKAGWLAIGVKKLMGRVQY